MLSKTAKGLLSVLLALCIVCTACLPAFAAVSYPDGVTNETAAETAQKTDNLIENAVSSFEEKSLKALVLPELFKSSTLSALLVKAYSSLSESSDTLSKLGIDITPAGVAKGLGDYPTVQSALESAADWGSVNLENAKWNIYDKYDFASAVAAAASPFNDILYTVLSSGTYKVSVIRFKGSNGYDNGLIPMLAALGCTWYEEPATFHAQAEKNKNSMVWDIVISIFSLFEEVLERPAMKLSETLPNLAHYIKDGGLEASVNELLKPFSLHIGNLVSLFSGSQMLSLLMFVQDPKKFTTNFSENINTVLADLTESSDIKLAPVDLDALKSCGTESDGALVANIGESFTLTFRWIVDTLKLNTEKVNDILTQTEELSTAAPIIQNLLKKETDEIFKLLVTLLTSEKGEEVDYEWTQKEFTPTSVSYTQNLGREKYQRVLDGIDSTINEFMVEFGDGTGLKKTLRNTIYSGTTIAKLSKGLYGALDGDMSEIVSALGVKTSTSSVASALRQNGFYNAASLLSSTYKWENVSEERLASCFETGNRKSFEKALTAVLTPFEPLFETLFANGTLTVLDSVNIPGSNGYNTAVIPLLEALGCPKTHILTYDQYVKGKGTDKIIGAIITPVLDLVDKICKKPVYTLTEILPNAVYFVSNGSLMQCLENLLKPVLDLLDMVGVDFSSLGVDLEEIKKTDVLSALADMIPDATKDTLVLQKPDLASVGGMGTIVQVQSKRTYAGKSATVYAVQADQTAVLISLLRYIVGAVQAPENSKVVSEMMAPKEGEETNMFSQYSSGIGDQLAEMTTDEAIEWLYKLFFRERAVEETTGAYVYDKEIIYQEEETTDKKVVVIPILVVLFILLAIAILKRDKIRNYLDERGRKRAEKKAQKQKELDAAIEKLMMERDAKAAEKAAADSKKESENEANREA